jgi:GNAT superfamily N-acetyltransferase
VKLCIRRGVLIPLSDGERLHLKLAKEDVLTEVSAEAIESVNQLADTWRAFVMDRGPGDVRDLPGMAIRWADSKFPFWNCITLTEPGVDRRLLDERLAQAVVYMRQKTQPGLIRLFEDLLEPSCRAEVPTAADQAGLELSFTGFGMVSDISSITEPLHPGLTFVRVSSDEELTAYADLNSRAYGMPLEAGRDGLCGSKLWKSSMYTYLGLADGIPVSAAATRQTGDCLFLALVATAPEAQGKGFGETTVRKALFEGAKATGLTRSVLHATPAGAPVYERIGFHKVAAIHFYGVRS